MSNILNAKKQKSNRGFTLVELIIVVAMIAVLIAVIAPQYTMYVERSRQSNDLQVATMIMDAALVAISDPDNEIPSGSVITIRWRTADGGQNIEVYNNALYNNGTMHSNGTTTLLANLKNSIDEVISFDGGKQDAQSTVGNSQHFVFRVYSDTGRIEVAATNPTPDSNNWNYGSGLWVSEIGVDAPTAAGFYF